MNLAIRGIDANITIWRHFYERLHSLNLKVDYIIANPPFNVSDWNRQQRRDTKMEIWRSANRKRQLCLVATFRQQTCPYGTAGIVLANGSMSSEIGLKVKSEKSD